MSGGSPIVLAFAGEDRAFRLGIGEWRRIQAKCDAGPEELLARLAPTVGALERELPVLQAVSLGLVGRWRVDDVREVILQGLMGGDPKGMDTIAATRLVQDHVDDRPLRASAALAFAIVMASIQGVPDEPPKKADDAGERAGEAADPAPSPAAS